MLLVLIGWLYVVGLWALIEATSPNGTVLGAVFTLVFYGLVPLAVVLYIGGTQARWRASHREAIAALPSTADPDQGHQPTGEPVAPEGKEP